MPYLQKRKLLSESLLLFKVELFEIKFRPYCKEIVLFTMPRQNLLWKSFNYLSLYHLFN